MLVPSSLKSKQFIFSLHQILNFLNNLSSLSFYRNEKQLILLFVHTETITLSIVWIGWQLCYVREVFKIVKFEDILK